MQFGSDGRDGMKKMKLHNSTMATRRVCIYFQDVSMASEAGDIVNFLYAGLWFEGRRKV